MVLLIKVLLRTVHSALIELEELELKLTGLANLVVTIPAPKNEKGETTKKGTGATWCYS